MNVLVLNTGSSSLKFQVIDTDLEAIEKHADRQLARGLIERIGSESLVTFRVEGKPAVRRTAALRDHRAALDYVLRWLVSPEAGVPGLASIGDIHAVGHRTVHGGEKFARSVLDVKGQSNVRGRLVTEIAPRAAQAFLASNRHEG